MKNRGKKAYAAAGVDIALGNRVKKGLQEKVRSTFGPEVLGRIGGFGGLFRADFGGLKEPVLVSSIDGVGTKLKVAIALGKHESIAQDLVNHCIDDIAADARPGKDRFREHRSAQQRAKLQAHHRYHRDQCIP